MHSPRPWLLFVLVIVACSAPSPSGPCGGGSCVDDAATPRRDSGAMPADAGAIPEDSGPGADSGPASDSDGGSGEGSDAGTAAAPLDCAALEAAGFQLCAAFDEACEIVFEDGTGCAAACASAGLRCAESFEDSSGACAPDRARPPLGCAATGHSSDYCVCAASDCVPSCEGRDCGSDGCGGSCGSCGAPTASCRPGDCPAFPGAEGFGWDATGGRGGDVCHVTNTNDTGSGSLRRCLDTARGPRTVVFDVGGEIDLRSTLRASVDRLTLAGQTAPRGGVTVTGYDVNIEGDHNIIQHMRFRSGDRRKMTSSRDGHTEDSLTVDGAHVIVDHVSASWGIDESLSLQSSDWDRITIQHCIIAEGLRRTRLFHGEYDSSHSGHSMGGLYKTRGRDHAHLTLHHNLFAHNNNRNPAIGSYSTSEAQTVDIRNNVIYNGGGGMGYTSGDSRWLHVNYVGNYGVWGADTRASSMFRCNRDNNVDIHWAGNYADRDRDGRIDGREESGVSGDYDREMSEFAVPRVTTESAPDALSRVLDSAGARPWSRDPVDLRIVADVRSGSGRIVDSVSEAGGYPSVASGTRVVDADRDGMPDAFERSMGTDPARADNNGDVDGDGYTNLEGYLHWAGRIAR